LSELESLTTGSHVFAVYSDIDQELAECFAFLRAGYEMGEAIWIAEEDLSKDQIRERIRREWNIKNLEELEASGVITITTSREWYYPEGKFDLDQVVVKWHKAVQDAVNHGRRGLRAFDSVDGLLKNGFSEDLVKFEAVLGTSFKIPFTAICAYKAIDISKFMDNEQFSSLHLSHGLKRMSGHDVLKNPPQHGHIALMYEDDSQRNAAVAKFINEGLRRDELCVYASIQTRVPGHLGEFSRSIDNYEENVEGGNLLIIDFAPFYIAAISDDLEPFEEASKQIKESAKKRKNKNVRFVGDCADFLFKNEHFDECIRLEEWGQSEPFEGCYLCPYPKQLINKYPHDLHKFRVQANHDIVADGNGNILAAYSDLGRTKDRARVEH
jgi:hypothetical protein